MKTSVSYLHDFGLELTISNGFAHQFVVMWRNSRTTGFGRTNSGPGSLGKARWRDRVILDGRVRGFGRGGRVWGRPKKTNLGWKWVETEDEGKSSCEKLRVAWRSFWW